VRLRAQIAPSEVGQGPSGVAAHNPFPSHGLLADAGRHLGEIEHAAARSAYCHDHSGVVQSQMPAGDLARRIPGLS